MDGIPRNVAANEAEGMDQVKPLGGHDIQARETQRQRGADQRDDTEKDPPKVIALDEFGRHPARKHGHEEAHDLPTVEE